MFEDANGSHSFPGFQCETELETKISNFRILLHFIRLRDLFPKKSDPEILMAEVDPAFAGMTV